MNETLKVEWVTKVWKDKNGKEVISINRKDNGDTVSVVKNIELAEYITDLHNYMLSS